MRSKAAGDHHESRGEVGILRLRAVSAQDDSFE